MNAVPSDPPDRRSAVLAAAELQDHLLAVTSDLAHLQGLLTHACETLMDSFLGATVQVRRARTGGEAADAALDAAAAHLGKAAKALQFQDMSSQLLAHASQRLRHCCDRLAQDLFAGDDGDDDGGAVVEPAPERPNPVTQSEVDTGFVELF